MLVGRRDSILATVKGPRRAPWLVDRFRTGSVGGYVLYRGARSWDVETRGDHGAGARPRPRLRLRFVEEIKGRLCNSELRGHDERSPALGFGDGSGHIAGVFAEDMAFTGSGRVVAIGSRSQEAADRFGDKFNIPKRHSSYEGLVADPEVDAVYVATPHPFTLPTHFWRWRPTRPYWWRSRSP